MEEGCDICYKCSKIQEYGTMKDINEIDFDIYCDECIEDKVRRDEY